MTTINEKIAEKIAGLVPIVENEVIDLLVAKELKKRSDAIVTAMGLLEVEERGFKRLVPDSVTYDDNGTATSSGFTKGRIDERKKATVKMEKLTKAIEKAITKGDMSDVYNLANSKPEKEGRDQGKGADSGSSA